MKTALFILLLNMIYPGKRQVLLFYSNSGTEKKNEQLALLNSQNKNVQERNIEIHTYEISKDGKEVKQWKVQASDAFTFILVGKDGGEKMRTDTVVSMQQLFATIDAMPMRKQEMKP